MQFDPNSVRQEPYPLPTGFEWSPLDLDNDDDLHDVKTNENEENDVNLTQFLTIFRFG